MRRVGVIAIGVMLLLSACSTSMDGSNAKAQAPHGDTATFGIDGSSTQVTESGHADFSLSSSPELTYSGPLGCKGQFFSGSYSEHIGISFRYTAADAEIVLANVAYHLAGPPQQIGDELVWDQTVTAPGQAPPLRREGRCPLAGVSTTPLVPPG